MRRWCCALSAFLAMGCASVEFQELREERASSRAAREDNAGLIVSCRPITAREEVLFFFGVDVLGQNILPVVVYMENTGEDTFTFRPAEMRLVPEDSTPLHHLPWQGAHERVAFSYWRAVPGFFFVLFPGFIITSSVSTANERLLHRFRSLTLDEMNLTPGAHTQGVVFLARRDGGPLNLKALPGSDIRLPFLRRTGTRTLTAEVVFYLRGDR